VNPKVEDKSQVWVWVEHHHEKLARISLGLLSKARELCQQLGNAEVASVLIGTNSQQLVTELIDHGSDKVYLVNKPSYTPFQTDLYAHLMTQLIQSHRPEIVLWGATRLGQETASRVAAKVGTGLTAHCIDLYIEEINEKPQLVTVVAGWGGNLTLKIISPEKRPQMATVKSGIFSPPEPVKRNGEVIPVEPEDKAPPFEIIEMVEEQEETLSLEKAEVVVAAGWGLSTSGDFQAAEDLAEILGGVVAGTRPALDAGWIPAERMIGQSGKTVAPQLLVTLGVSGAPQFATGVLNSKVIFAVDKNPQAPIFEMADIGIVGDLQDVLPLLINKLRALKGQS
jgi:electron transfer flavoprotein alpha subunit